MKGKRIKGYKKEFRIYQTALRFKPPYNLLVEASFIELCLSQKIDLKERLEEVIGPNYKLISSSCNSSELKKLKLFDKFNNIYKNLRLFNRRCSHVKCSSKECVLKQIDKINSSKFIVLSSDVELNNELQKTCSSTPIFSVFKGILIMLGLNELTKNKLNNVEKKQNSVNNGELKFIEKKFELNVESNEVEYAPKKKKAKGPNPLSVKKKTKAASSVETRDKPKDQNTKSDSPAVLIEKPKEQDSKPAPQVETIEESIEQEIKSITNEQTPNPKKRKRKHKKKSKNSSASEEVEANKEEDSEDDDE